MNNKLRQTNLLGMLEQVDPTRQLREVQGRLESRTSAESRGSSLDVKRTNTEALESQMALETLDVVRRGGKVDSDQQFVLEAIVMPYYRPVIDVVDDYIVKEQLTSKWERLGRELPVETVKQWVRGVGRIDVPNIKYAGTGFLVGDGLLMTNRHVAAFFAQGLGRKPRVSFQPGQSASVDFYHENGKATAESLVVEEVIMIHPGCDMALIRVKGLPSNRVPLKLSTADPATLAEREVVVIGYPGYDPEGDQEFQRVQSRIFRDTYYVKRFQPGIFKSRDKVKSYQRTVDVVSHDCSTLGGNSGSAVIDLSTGHVVGLHFLGSYLVANYAVSPFDLARDSRVVDAGVQFEGPRLDPTGDFYGDIWRATESAESFLSPGIVDGGPNLQSASDSGQPAPSTATPHGASSGNTMGWTVPLQVCVSVGTPTLASPTESPMWGSEPAQTPSDRK